MDKKTKVIMTLGMVFAAYAGYALVSMTDRLVSWGSLLDVVIFIAMILCFWGLCTLKRWAPLLSLVLALAALGWSFQLVRFVWTFWIFQEPTLLDRVANELHPRVSVFFLFPAFWLFYFTRPKIRAFFTR